MRAVYADGVVEIDFLTREVINTTPASAGGAGDGRSAGRSGCRLSSPPCATATRPGAAEQAARRVETALLIEEAADASLPAATRVQFGRLAAAG